MKNDNQQDNALQQIWENMFNACYCPTNTRYLLYGFIGIKIDKQWKENPSLFYEWAVGRGFKEGLTIERIDKKKDFSPKNCRIIRGLFDAPRKNNAIYLSIDGDERTISEWAEFFRINRSKIVSRYQSGGIKAAEDFIKILFEDTICMQGVAGEQKKGGPKPYILWQGFKCYYLRGVFPKPPPKPKQGWNNPGIDCS